uniref:Dehydration-responsive element-binding protein 1G n=1 Tax=Lilium longiflorum TaxID=4690 RepID=A0A5C2IF84_LILLO|nr:dehydration-responsive element-binding protein 1G [Lilium longiflorum]
MDTISSDSDSRRQYSHDSPPALRSVSDEEAYTTISSAPPKRRAGRTKFRETRHPVYKGVRRRNADKWVCEVREPNKKSRIWLGTFPTAEMAARAHDVAAIALRGRSACLNFADSAGLPMPESTSPRDIQRAAAAAAEAFRPSEEQRQAMSEEGSSVATATAAAAMSEADNVFDMEDGLEFGIQGYFDMAQGLLIDPPPPPPPTCGDMECDCDVPLWNYD